MRSRCQICLVTLKMYSSNGLRDAKGFPKLDVWRSRRGVGIPVVTGTEIDLTGTTVKYRGRGVVLSKSWGIKFWGCWGAVNTSPVLGIDSEIVWLLEGSFQDRAICAAGLLSNWLAPEKEQYNKLREVFSTKFGN